MVALGRDGGGCGACPALLVQIWAVFRQYFEKDSGVNGIVGSDDWVYFN